jgi:hypothetical protein
MSRAQHLLEVAASTGCRSPGLTQRGQRGCATRSWGIALQVLPPRSGLGRTERLLCTTGLQSITPALARSCGKSSFFAPLCMRRGFFAQGCVQTCKASKVPNTCTTPAPPSSTTAPSCAAAAWGWSAEWVGAWTVGGPGTGGHLANRSVGQVTFGGNASPARRPTEALRTSRLTTPAARDLLSARPDRLPLARWPSDSGHPLPLSRRERRSTRPSGGSARREQKKLPDEPIPIPLP